MQWRPLLQLCCPGSAVREEVSAVRARSWARGGDVGAPECVRGEGSCGGLSPALWERLGGAGGAQPEERSCMRAAGGRGAVRASPL